MWTGFIIPPGTTKNQAKHMKLVFRHWTLRGAAYCPMPEKTCLICLKNLEWEINNFRDFTLEGSVSWLLNVVINNNEYWQGTFTGCFLLLNIYRAEQLYLGHLIWGLYKEQFLQAYKESVKRLLSLGAPTVFQPSYLQYLQLIPHNNLWGVYCYPHPLNEEMGLREV